MGLLFRPRRPVMRLVAGAGSPAPSPTTPPDQGSAPDRTSELERLARLHDSGSLTDDEFAAAKVTILGP